MTKKNVYKDRVEEWINIGGIEKIVSLRYKDENGNPMREYRWEYDVHGNLVCFKNNNKEFFFDREDNFKKITKEEFNNKYKKEGDIWQRKGEEHFCHY